MYKLLLFDLYLPRVGFDGDRDTVDDASMTRDYRWVKVFATSAAGSRINVYKNRKTYISIKV